ncbi:trypsin-like peptidase domain-containing protein [Spirillospora sp. NPDC029432]|uniref:S1C family serine protease n=1 Tax=Spirillospora sp. NPDC029432 TaxID=3154599 RepID=UPI003453F982
MTEDSRGPVRSSLDDDDLDQDAGRAREDAAGAGGAQEAVDDPQDDHGAAAVPDDRDDLDDPGAPVTEKPVALGKESPGISDRLVAGFAPPDSYGRDDDIPAPPSPTAVDQPVPEGSVPGDPGAVPGPGEAPVQGVVPDGVVPDGPVPDGPVPGSPVPGSPVPGEAAASAMPPPGGDPARQRPGFVPHGYDQDPRMAAHQQPGQPGDPRAAAQGGQGTPYGWPPHQSQRPPHGGTPLAGPPPGAPPGAGPMGPPGARPMGHPGMPGQPPGGPNWAPVPSLPSASRGGPGLGVLAVVALVVALVAGGLGAGIGVLATGDGDEPGSISLGGGSGGGQAKNRPPDSVAGIAQKVLPSVVMIRVAAAGGEGAGGTGFIVNGGYIITNNHVVASGGSGGEIQVVFNDKKTLPATIKGRDPSSDIAVLKPEGAHRLPALQLGNSDDLAVGDPVIAIGSPLGLQGSVTTGIVSSMNRAVPTGGEGGGDASVLNAIQTDAAINPGNSGGPLVDGKGRVIGINTAIATLGGRGLGGESQSGSIGLGFAIPINQGKRVAQEIINTGGARRAQLGIGMDQQYQGPGVKIATQAQQGVQPIVKGSAADKAGLRPGDVITKLGDQPIEGPADLSAQISSRGPGDKVKVTYQRDGKETTVEVTLGQAN